MKWYWRTFLDFFVRSDAHKEKETPEEICNTEWSVNCLRNTSDTINMQCRD